MRIIESRRRMLESIGLSGTVFYLQSQDGSVTKAFEFEEGMLWSEFVASNYNNGLFTMDDTTELKISKSNMGSLDGSVMGCLGYNGYYIDTKNEIPNGIWLITEKEGNDSLEVGRTYYCDGVL